MGRNCQPYVAEAATKIVLDPDLSARQALVLVGCPVFTEAIKRAVNRKKISMEDIIAIKLDAKNAKKRKRDAAKALSKAPHIQMPILAGPSFVSPPPLDTVSISTMVNGNHSFLSSLSSASNIPTTTALIGQCDSQQSITIHLEEFQVSKKDPSGFGRSTAPVVKSACVKKKKERLTDRDRAYRVATTLYANEQERKMRGEKNTMSSKKVAEKIGSQFGVAISESTLRRKVNIQGLANVGLTRTGPKSRYSSR